MKGNYEILRLAGHRGPIWWVIITLFDQGMILDPNSCEYSLNPKFTSGIFFLYYGNVRTSTIFNQRWTCYSRGVKGCYLVLRIIYSQRNGVMDPQISDFNQIKALEYFINWQSKLTNIASLWQYLQPCERRTLLSLDARGSCEAGCMHPSPSQMQWLDESDGWWEVTCSFRALFTGIRSIFI